MYKRQDRVNEDATVTKTGSQDDVMNDDTDADDDDTFTVTKIKKENGSDSNVSSEVHIIVAAHQSLEHTEL